MQTDVNTTKKMQQTASFPQIYSNNKKGRESDEPILKKL